MVALDSADGATVGAVAAQLEHAFAISNVAIGALVSRVYGFILAGETLGLGAGSLLSGEVAAALSWRAAFVILAVPGVALAATIRRPLPEPALGGRGRLSRGARSIRDCAPGRRSAPARDEPREARPIVEEAVEQRDLEPRRELVLDEDPVAMPLWTYVHIHV